MAVDEKYINGEFYTLLSNAQTSKTALIAYTTKAALLTQAMKKFSDRLFNVRILTRASNYECFVPENFMNAARVTDKFHVLKNAFSALQDLRIYYRQKLLTQRREAYETFKYERKRIRN